MKKINYLSLTAQIEIRNRILTEIYPSNTFLLTQR